MGGNDVVGHSPLVLVPVLGAGKKIEKIRIDTFEVASVLGRVCQAFPAN